MDQDAESRTTAPDQLALLPCQSKLLCLLRVLFEANKPRGNSNINKARVAIKNDIAYASGDSSADEEVEHPYVAPVPDAEVTYSFDAQRGPSHGSQILNHALTQAIERYEVRETDKLIKNEYEVLGFDEALSPGPRVARKGVAPEDEDYEFVDA